MVGRTIRKGSALYMGAAIGVSLLCLLATLFDAELARQTTPLARLRHLNLIRENEFGAWWSGMLLLLASLHAADGYMRHRFARRGVARGWAALAVILVVLSLDEVGSLHERIGAYLGSWPALLPLAAVLGALGLVTLWSFWRSANHRAQAWWIGAAFALFGLVAVQEALEIRTRWWGDFVALRAGLEEGSELLGMLILLGVTSANTRAPWPMVEILQIARLPLLIVGLAAAPLLGWAATVLTDHNRGSPAAWLAAAGFLAAAITMAWPLLRARVALGWKRCAASGLCVVLSMSAVIFNPALRPGPSARILLAGALAVAVLAFASAAPERRSAQAWPLALMALLLSVVGFGSSLGAFCTVQIAIALLAFHMGAGLGADTPARPHWTPAAGERAHA